MFVFASALLALWTSGCFTPVADLSGFADAGLRSADAGWPDASARRTDAGAPHGLPCDDRDPCTFNDSRGADGVCSGEAYSCRVDECDESSACDGRGSCVVHFKPLATACGAPSECSASACDGAGACVETALPNGVACSRGACCGGGCVNLASSASNCGACGEACDSGGCFQGLCYPPGWQKLPVYKYLSDAYVTPEGQLFLSGAGLHIGQPDGTFLAVHNLDRFDQVWADDEGAILVYGSTFSQSFVLGRSVDAGRTFEFSTLPDNLMCRDFVSVESQVWCASDIVMRSFDRGATWHQANPSGHSDQVLGLWTPDNQNLFAVGSVMTNDVGPAFVLHSADAGLSWTRFPAPARMWAVHGTALDNVWAVGERGTVLHCSTQGCEQPGSLAATGEEFRGVFTRGDDVFVLGSTFYRSPDRGTTWVKESIPTPFLIGLAGTADGSLFAVNPAGLFGRFP